MSKRAKVVVIVSAVALLLLALAIKSGGSLWAWGWNKCGQLGDGTDIDRYLPKKSWTT